MFVPSDARGQKRLLLALVIDALGSGLFVPLSLLFFVATTPLSLPQVGLALSAAAIIRIPATIGAGALTDQLGARRAVVLSQLLQALGFVNYLFVGSFWYLVLAAGLVQIGNSVFWVSYQALVSEVAADDSQERWFALCAAMRTAGTALGGVGAGVAIVLGGHGGYVLIVISNAVSFIAAAVLIWKPHSKPAAPVGPAQVNPSSTDTSRDWKSVLGDGPFVWFVVLNFGFTLLSLAFALPTPVYLVRTVGLPIWTPGVVLALNAVLGTVAVPYVVGWITGRSRSRVLTISQAMIAIGFALFLLASYVPRGAALAIAITAVVLVAGCEVIQGAVVPAVVTDAAPPANLGRYLSVYQLTFAVGDIVAPTLVTTTLTHGALTLWTPLIAIALVGMLLIAIIARRLQPLRQPIGTRPPPDLTREMRRTEADGL